MSNLASLLQRHLATPDKVLYAQHIGGAWHDFSAGQVMLLAARWQQAFRDLGLAAGDRVAICLRNSPNWVAIDQAALGLGLVPVPLYVDDNGENVAWCLGNSGARLLVLENIRLLEALRRAMPVLPTIVCFQADAPAPAIPVEGWLPEAMRPFEVIDAAPDALASIIYTSGTTGRPKGVMLSHRNILSNIEAALQVIRVHDTDVMISVLPLSHMFERTCGYYVPLAAGAKVVYARSIQQLGEDLAACRPTVLIAVPRIFERFLARIEQNLAGSFLKRQLFRLTARLGWRCFKKSATAPERLAWRLLRPLVAAPILARLGGRLRLAVVGGAAVEGRISRTFIGLGLNMVQGYGLTETSPVVAGNREEDNEPASVGAPLPGLEIRVNEAHELLVRGPGVMLGYWRNPEATRAVLSPDGWLNTGDLADIRDGRIYIKGRSKDILALSNGEKLPPEEVEAAILDDHLFEQVMLVGEGRAYLTLLAVTRESDEKKLVRQANAQLRHFPRYVRIRRVIAVKEPWTVDDGLLTPTQKIRRQALLERFCKQIERSYAG